MKLFDPLKYDPCYECRFESKDGMCKIRKKAESCIYLKGEEATE